jgi:hypothetical protein
VGKGKACERPEDGCSNPPGISPGKRPENALNPRAYWGAYKMSSKVPIKSRVIRHDLSNRRSSRQVRVNAGEFRA